MPILVSEKRGCHLCHNTFSCPDVVCLPGAVPVHTHCIAHRLSDSALNTHADSAPSKHVDSAPNKHSTQNSNHT